MTLDRSVLCSYLSGRLPGFDEPEAIESKQLTGGQSNPTYALTTPAGAYVLRKKPAGTLLPSAHAIEREYAVMNALAGLVPVPKMHLFCDDCRILGQSFYIMEHVEGRLFPDARMLGAPRQERRALSLELVSILARLHAVDYHAVGLVSYGKIGGYVDRQLTRLSKQYAASRVEDNADMNLVIRWLEGNRPNTDESAIVHGDYRSYNVLFQRDASRVAAILDWELATIGHPLADLAFACLPYHMTAADPRGFHGEDPSEFGVPSEAELVDHYCCEAGRADISDWRYFLVFALFRSAAIRAGVYQRAMEGSAAGLNALEAGSRYRDSAAAAAHLMHEGLR